MTIQVNLADLADLAELVAHIEAGEDFVLVRDGEALAVINAAKAPAGGRPNRVPGAWAKYGPLQDPELFLRPDPELEALMDEPIFPVRT